MTLAVWILCTVAGTCLAVGAALWLGRSARSREGEFNSQALSFAGGVVLSSFILVTGFLIVGAWQLQSVARSHAHEEARVLAKAYSSAGQLDARDRDEVRDRITAYTHTVIDDEWPDLARHHASPAAWRELDAVQGALNAVPEDRRASGFEATSEAVDEVYVKRYARLADLDAVSPSVLFAAMIVAGVLVLVYPPVVGMTANRRNIALLGFAGAVVGFGILLVYQMRDPFTAPLSVGPSAFEAALVRFGQLT
ncbi:DUF4239 domain-containing protein [Yinghuangia sp. ASG 101]|uniref:bestrophin-like domain n=1 Tax=Yinghuangia sp. ASG 101 TaxID=2896848 RepID=UPI001E2B2DBC|nr:DUF4239 domain-containing protein [Yinghuangia sp. ASG 101]UGQ10884.1 DUF4239 domain-containing protein [Yinghuangia sp. ASG 101]